MYNFRPMAVTQMGETGYPHSVPTTDPAYLRFLKKLKSVRPVVLEITDETGRSVGRFTGGLTRFLGIQVLGSPFWGWIGQHMGFDWKEEVDKAALVDDLIDYAVHTLHAGYVQFTDLKIGYDDLAACRHQLIPGERYKTCYIDLTQPEAQLFKNLKSGYRTCIRKFEKEGGVIEEDYSNAFIDEHANQLREVFTRQGLKTPNYRRKMHLLFHSPDFSHGPKGFGVYSIKAMLPVKMDDKVVMTNVASSYYIHNGYLAMFASNASRTAFLRSNPNQALTWHAMMAFKNAGLGVLDMGGSGDYKLNFSGGEWEPKPIVIYSKNRWNEFVILGLKHQYGVVVRRIGTARNVLFALPAKLKKAIGESDREEET